MGGIFINYRGEDSQTAAALIDRELTARFGSDLVFQASRSIPVRGRQLTDARLGPRREPPPRRSRPNRSADRDDPAGGDTRDRRWSMEHYGGRPADTGRGVRHRPRPPNSQAQPNATSPTGTTQSSSRCPSGGSQVTHAARKPSRSPPSAHWTSPSPQPKSLGWSLPGSMHRATVDSTSDGTTCSYSTSRDARDRQIPWFQRRLTWNSTTSPSAMT